MQWLTRGAMATFGLVTLLCVSGCDVEGQILDTIGLAWDIVGVWVD